MSTRGVLRTLAIAIALAAFLDPAATKEALEREPLTIVAIGSNDVQRAGRLRELLAADANVRISTYDATSSAAACPAAGGCVIVSSGEVPAHVTAGARVLGALMMTSGAEKPPVISRIEAPSRVHRNASATLRVHTTRPARQIQIFDGDLVVGSAEPSSTPAEISWVPIADGARVLRVVADDEAADVGVVVTPSPVTVLFYEPQATWLGTFVRRAVEDDSRFVLSGRAQLGPRISVSRGDPRPLRANLLDDVSAIFVTAPELLSAAEVDVIEQFVVQRGGSLVVLADQRPAGAATRLFPRVTDESRSPQPQSIGLLRATEWLTFEASTGVSTIASLNQQPVVVSRAVGRGHVIMSGALDAWRFRQASDGFDTFWTTLAWDAAVVAGPPLRVETDRPIARPGEEIRVIVERQSLGVAVSDTEVAVSAYAQCGDPRQFIRLWPGARPGLFTGTLRVDDEGHCTITADVGNMTGRTPVTIRDDVRRLPVAGHRLQAIVAAHGGLLVTPADEDRLVSRIDEQLTSVRASTPYWPMRSPAWLIPFAGCLGVEWWLRRRSGVS
jgi:hypothetical protein